MSRKIYFVSGTLGSGKTTVSVLLANKIGNSIRIEADNFLHQTEGSGIEWGQRLKLMWDEVIKVAEGQPGKNVVIDGVVEEELPMLKRVFSKDQLYYGILVADEETLRERISKRGDQHSIPRSLQLLNQFKRDSSKRDFLINTSKLSPEATANLLAKRDPL